MTRQDDYEKMGLIKRLPSYDTLAKVAGAEKKGLERIVGMSPQKVRSIVTQARTMMGAAEKSRHTWL